MRGRPLPIWVLTGVYLRIYLISQKNQTRAVGSQNQDLGRVLMKLWVEGAEVRRVDEFIASFAQFIRWEAPMGSSRRLNDVVRHLQNHGWTLSRISGSHHIFEKDGEPLLSLPVHGKRVKSCYGSKIDKACRKQKG